MAFSFALASSLSKLSANQNRHRYSNGPINAKQRPIADAKGGKTRASKFQLIGLAENASQDFEIRRKETEKIKA